MKKLHITMIILLAVVMFLGGCSEKNNNSAPATDTSNSSVSSTDISQPKNSTEDEFSSTESSVQSSTESIPETVSEPVTPVPVEFTDEDRELQEILSELADPAAKIDCWTHLELGLPEFIFNFPQLEVTYNLSYTIPDNYHLSEDSQLAFPSTCAEMEALMLKYFSKQQTKEYMRDIVPGIVTEEPVKGSNNAITVTFDDNTLSKLHIKDDFGEYFLTPLFLELNGRMYRKAIQGVNHLIISEDTAKVISRTDDTIEFSYINIPGFQYLDPWTTDYEYEPFYSENALKGVLKYERGGWKLDSWGNE